MKESTASVLGNRSALDQLASYACDLNVSTLPPEVVAKAKICIIDALSACLTIGSILEGKCALTVASMYDTAKIATIFGTCNRVLPADAALVNGTSAAGTGRSDTHAATASHLGMVIIPAVLALAEARRCGGGAVIESIVAGYEAMCRLGAALITPKFATIFRPTGMIAPTGAAIAAGRVIGLDPSQLMNAASLATHTASGLNEWANSGTSELAYHAGFAARNAVTCALLAEAGTVSASTVLEGQSGLLAGYEALERSHLLTRSLGVGFKILEIVHKPAPACIFVQTPSQVALDLVRRNDIDPRDIEAIRIHTCRAGAEYPGCNDPGPITHAQAAKLSIQFGVASVFAARGIFDSNWLDFTNAQVNDLACRSTVIIDDELTSAFPGRQGCKIMITMKDGKAFKAEQNDFVSMPDQQIIERFVRVAEPKLGKAKSDRVIQLVADLERVDDIHELTECLCAD